VDTVGLVKRNTKVGERDALLVDAADAIDVALCSGKAAGLATLQRAGFAVPDTVCLTTECYRHWLEVSGLGPLLAGDVQDAALRPSDRSSVLA
jgi:pyruvate,water dikinase